MPLPRDLDEHPPACGGRHSRPHRGIGGRCACNAAANPAPLVPRVRITLTIPEDLRYRLKMTLMSQRRADRSKMTQDKFGSRAIAALLEQFTA